MEMKSLGTLFDTIEYYKPEDMRNIVDSIRYEQSLYFISLALEHANRHGLYTLVESEIISKSIRTLYLDTKESEVIKTKE